MIWAAWTTRLRWPAIVLNGAMLISTPIFGSHYLVDIIAGAGIAVVTIAAIEWMLAWSARAPRGVPTFAGEPAGAMLMREA